MKRITIGPYSCEAEVKKGRYYSSGITDIGFIVYEIKIISEMQELTDYLLFMKEMEHVVISTLNENNEPWRDVLRFDRSHLIKTKKDSAIIKLFLIKSIKEQA